MSQQTNDLGPYWFIDHPFLLPSDSQYLEPKYYEGLSLFVNLVTCKQIVNVEEPFVRIWIV